MTNKFAISIPMVGKSYKTTYNKQLEVYEYDDEYVVRTFTIKENKIVEIFPKSPKYINDLRSNMFRKGIPVNEPIIEYSGTTSKFLYFNNLELAMASKIYLLREMKQRYRQEIKRLEERLEKNMPKNLDKLFENLEENYAEYFI